MSVIIVMLLAGAIAGYDQQDKVSMAQCNSFIYEVKYSHVKAC